MNPCESAAAVTALAVLLHQNLSAEAAAYVAAVFVGIGDQMAVLETATACCQKQAEACQAQIQPQPQPQTQTQKQ